jgi:hypothetical protein
MTQHLIIGAGPIGRATVQALLDQGHHVKIMTRSGTTVPGCVSLQGDAAHLSGESEGCESIIVCTNPPYHQWPEQWPPVIASVIGEAQRTGARVVLMSNLYSYGRGSGVMNQETPVNPTTTQGEVRAQLWQMLSESSVAATELRVSDYFGPGAGDGAHAGDRLFKPVEKGKTAWVFGNPDVKHSWSYLPDIAQCLAILATREELSGTYWVAPFSGVATLRELAGEGAKVKQFPRLAVRFLALFNPMMKQLLAGAYMHDEPFLADDSAFQQATGFRPTPLDELTFRR